MNHTGLESDWPVTVLQIALAHATTMTRLEGVQPTATLYTHELDAATAVNTNGCIRDGRRTRNIRYHAVFSVMLLCAMQVFLLYIMFVQRRPPHLRAVGRGSPHDVQLDDA